MTDPVRIPSIVLDTVRKRIAYRAYSVTNFVWQACYADHAVTVRPEEISMMVP